MKLLVFAFAVAACLASCPRLAAADYCSCSFNSGASCKNVTVTAPVPGTIPVCSCPSGKTLVNGVCSSGSGTTYTTSVALYPEANFGGLPQIVRAGPRASICYNTRQDLRPNKILSYQILPNMGDAGKAQNYTTTAIVFWPQTLCYGQGTLIKFGSQPVLVSSTGANPFLSFSISGV